MMALRKRFTAILQEFVVIGKVMDPDLRRDDEYGWVLPYSHRHCPSLRHHAERVSASIRIKT
jgi:hypothetical protein